MAAVCCLHQRLAFLVLMVDLGHELLKLVVFPHLLKLSWVDIVLLNWSFSQSVKLLSYRWFYYLWLTNLLLVHFTSKDRCWFPHRIFRLNFPRIGIQGLNLVQTHVQKLTLNLALSLLRCVVVLSFSCMISLSQVEWDLRLRWSRIVSLCLIRILVGTAHHHSILNLSLQLLLHLLVSIRLLCRIKNAHCFEIEGADRSHEYFLQVFLHHVPVPIHCVLVLLCLSQFVSKGLNLLLVCGTNWLKLYLDRIIKLLFVSLYFSWFKLFPPGLKYSSQVFYSVFLLLVFEDQTSMLFKLAVTFQSKEAAHLGNTESGYC